MTLKKSISGYLFDFMLLIFVLTVMTVLLNQMKSEAPIVINGLLDFVLYLALPAFVFILLLSPVLGFLVFYALMVPTGLTMDDETLTIHRWFVKQTYSISDVSIYEKPRDKNGRKKSTGLFQSTYESRMYTFRVKNKNISLEYYRYDNATNFIKMLESKVENKYNIYSIF